MVPPKFACKSSANLIAYYAVLLLCAVLTVLFKYSTHLIVLKASSCSTLVHSLCFFFFNFFASVCNMDFTFSGTRRSQPRLQCQMCQGEVEKMVSLKTDSSFTRKSLYLRVSSHASLPWHKIIPPICACSAGTGFQGPGGF